MAEDEKTTPPFYDRWFNGINRTFKGQFQETTTTVATALEKSTEGKIKASDTKEYLPYVAAAGVAAGGMIFSGTLGKIGKGVANFAKNIVTGFGVFEKIPVIGGLFTTVGKGIDSISDSIGMVATAVATFLTFKVFQVKPVLPPEIKRQDVHPPGPPNFMPGLGFKNATDKLNSREKDVRNGNLKKEIERQTKELEEKQRRLAEEQEKLRQAQEALKKQTNRQTRSHLDRELQLQRDAQQLQQEAERLQAAEKDLKEIQKRQAKLTQQLESFKAAEKAFIEKASKGQTDLTKEIGELELDSVEIDKQVKLLETEVAELRTRIAASDITRITEANLAAARESLEAAQEELKQAREKLAKDAAATENERERLRLQAESLELEKQALELKAEELKNLAEEKAKLAEALKALKNERAAYEAQKFDQEADRKAKQDALDKQAEELKKKGAELDKKAQQLEDGPQKEKGREGWSGWLFPNAPIRVANFSGQKETIDVDPESVQKAIANWRSTNAGKAILDTDSLKIEVLKNEGVRSWTQRMIFKAPTLGVVGNRGANGYFEIKGESLKIFDSWLRGEIPKLPSDFKVDLVQAPPLAGWDRVKPWRWFSNNVTETLTNNSGQLESMMKEAYAQKGTTVQQLENRATPTSTEAPVVADPASQANQKIADALKDSNIPEADRARVAEALKDTLRWMRTGEGASDGAKPTAEQTHAAENVTPEQLKTIAEKFNAATPEAQADKSRLSKDVTEAAKDNPVERSPSSAKIPAAPKITAGSWAQFNTNPAWARVGNGVLGPMVALGEGWGLWNTYKDPKRDITLKPGQTLVTGGTKANAGGMILTGKYDKDSHEAASEALKLEFENLGLRIKYLKEHPPQDKVLKKKLNDELIEYEKELRARQVSLNKLQMSNDTDVTLEKLGICQRALRFRRDETGNLVCGPDGKPIEDTYIIVDPKKYQKMATQYGKTLAGLKMAKGGFTGSAATMKSGGTIFTVAYALSDAPDIAEKFANGHYVDGAAQTVKTGVKTALMRTPWGMAIVGTVDSYEQVDAIIDELYANQPRDGRKFNLTIPDATAPHGVKVLPITEETLFKTYPTLSADIMRVAYSSTAQNIKITDAAVANLFEKGEADPITKWIELAQKYDLPEFKGANKNDTATREKAAAMIDAYAAKKLHLSPEQITAQMQQGKDVSSFVMGAPVPADAAAKEASLSAAATQLRLSFLEKQGAKRVKDIVTKLAEDPVTAWIKYCQANKMLNKHWESTTSLLEDKNRSLHSDKKAPLFPPGAEHDPAMRRKAALMIQEYAEKTIPDVRASTSGKFGSGIVDMFADYGDGNIEVKMFSDEGLITVKGTGTNEVSFDNDMMQYHLAMMSRELKNYAVQLGASADNPFRNTGAEGQQPVKGLLLDKLPVVPAPVKGDNGRIDDNVNLAHNAKMASKVAAQGLQTFKETKVYTALMQYDTQRHENALVFIKEVRTALNAKNKGIKADQTGRDLLINGLVGGKVLNPKEAANLIVDVPKLRVTTYEGASKDADGDELPKELVTLATKFQTFYGDAQVRILTKGKFGDKSFDEMTITQKHEFLHAIKAHIEERDRVFKGRYKEKKYIGIDSEVIGKPGIKLHIHEWGDKHDFAEESVRDNWFGDKPEQTIDTANGKKKLSEEYAALVDMLDGSFGKKGGSAAKASIDETMKNFSGKLQEHMQYLRVAEQDRGAIAAYAHHARFMETSLVMTQDHNSILVAGNRINDGLDPLTGQKRTLATQADGWMLYKDLKSNRYYYLEGRWDQDKFTVKSVIDQATGEIRKLDLDPRNPHRDMTPEEATIDLGAKEYLKAAPQMAKIMKTVMRTETQYPAQVKEVLAGLPALLKTYNVTAPKIIDIQPVLGLVTTGTPPQKRYAMTATKLVFEGGASKDIPVSGTPVSVLKGDIISKESLNVMILANFDTKAALRYRTELAGEGKLKVTQLGSDENGSFVEMKDNRSYTVSRDGTASAIDRANHHFIPEDTLHASKDKTYRVYGEYTKDAAGKEVFTARSVRYKDSNGAWVELEKHTDHVKSEYPSYMKDSLKNPKAPSLGYFGLNHNGVMALTSTGSEDTPADVLASRLREHVETKEDIKTQAKMAIHHAERKSLRSVMILPSADDVIKVGSKETALSPERMNKQLRMSYDARTREVSMSVQIATDGVRSADRGRYQLVKILPESIPQPDWTRGASIQAYKDAVNALPVIMVKDLDNNTTLDLRTGTTTDSSGKVLKTDPSLALVKPEKQKTFKLEDGSLIDLTTGNITSKDGAFVRQLSPARLQGFIATIPPASVNPDLQVSFSENFGWNAEHNETEKSGPSAAVHSLSVQKFFVTLEKSGLKLYENKEKHAAQYFEPIPVADQKGLAAGGANTGTSAGTGTGSGEANTGTGGDSGTNKGTGKGTSGDGKNADGIPPLNLPPITLPPMAGGNPLEELSPGMQMMQQAQNQGNGMPVAPEGQPDKNGKISDGMLPGGNVKLLHHAHVKMPGANGALEDKQTYTFQITDPANPGTTLAMAVAGKRLGKYLVIDTMNGSNFGMPNAKTGKPSSIILLDVSKPEKIGESLQKIARNPMVNEFVIPDIEQLPKIGTLPVLPDGTPLSTKPNAALPAAPLVNNLGELAAPLGANMPAPPASKTRPSGDVDF